jgi:hypothetical protein
MFTIQGTYLLVQQLTTPSLQKQDAGQEGFQLTGLAACWQAQHDDML